MGFDHEAEEGPELRRDRYYLVSDAGSFFFDPGGDNDGFESTEAAAEWARTQTVWPPTDRRNAPRAEMRSGGHPSPARGSGDAVLIRARQAGAADAMSA